MHFTALDYSSEIKNLVDAHSALYVELDTVVHLSEMVAKYPEFPTELYVSSTPSEHLGAVASSIDVSVDYLKETLACFPFLAFHRFFPKVHMMDEEFNTYATERCRSVNSLETVDTQVVQMDELHTRGLDKFREQAKNEFENPGAIKRYYESFQNAYAAGDADYLQSCLLPLTPLGISRNVDMVSVLKKSVRAPSLIVVGLSHLVGEKPMLDYLK